MVTGGCVYIITNKWHTTLYTGVTSDLYSRILDHKEKKYPTSFSARYNLHKLVYYESFIYIEEAINREKEMKHFTRARKERLINKMNPKWEDLFLKEVSNGKCMHRNLFRLLIGGLLLPPHNLADAMTVTEGLFGQSYSSFRLIDQSTSINETWPVGASFILCLSTTELEHLFEYSICRGEFESYQALVFSSYSVFRYRDFSKEWR